MDCLGCGHACVRPYVQQKGGVPESSVLWVRARAGTVVWNCVGCDEGERRFLEASGVPKTFSLVVAVLQLRATDPDIRPTSSGSMTDAYEPVVCVLGTRVPYCAARRGTPVTGRDLRHRYCVCCTRQSVQFGARRVRVPLGVRRVLWK